MPSAGSFSLDFWGFSCFFPHSRSNQDILFTYQSSHSPDLMEDLACKWQDFVGRRNLYLLLFPSALTSLPRPSSPSCSRVALAGPDFILFLVLGAKQKTCDDVLRPKLGHRCLSDISRCLGRHIIFAYLVKNFLGNAGKI